MEVKPNAYVCEHGHITMLSPQKIRFADGMLCPVCGEGKGYLAYVGMDLGCDEQVEGNVR